MAKSSAKSPAGRRAREGPRPTEKEPQHLCLDAGYDNQMSRETVKDYIGIGDCARQPLIHRKV